ncbi:retrovirus-related pol polyprotein from transposon TNT 1-94 [Tanacetum coccineum]
MASNEKTNDAGTDTRPPMLVESDYDSWKIRIHRYIRGKPNGKQIWKSIQNGPTPHPMIMSSTYESALQGLQDTSSPTSIKKALQRDLGLMWRCLCQGSGRTIQQEDDLVDEYERFRAMETIQSMDTLCVSTSLRECMKILAQYSTISRTPNLYSSKATRPHAKRLSSNRQQSTILLSTRLCCHTTSGPALFHPPTTSSGLPPTQGLMLRCMMVTLFTLKQFRRKAHRVDVGPMLLLLSMATCHRSAINNPVNEMRGSNWHFAEDLRLPRWETHSKVLELEAEISKQKQLISESEKRFAFLEQNYVRQNMLQGKMTLIKNNRNLDAQINIMKVLNVGSTEGSTELFMVSADSGCSRHVTVSFANPYNHNPYLSLYQLCRKVHWTSATTFSVGQFCDGGLEVAFRQHSLPITLRYGRFSQSTELELTALQSGRSGLALVKTQNHFFSVPPTRKQVDDCFNGVGDVRLFRIPPVVPITPVNVPAAPTPENAIVHLPQQLSQKALLHPDIVFSSRIKWIFKIKLDEYGDVLKNKLVARLEAIRLFIAHAASMNMVIFQMDVKTAFLNWRMNEVGLYDIIFASTNPKACKLFAFEMNSTFKMSMMGQMSFFLGLQVSKNPRGIFINQSKYAQEILKKFGFDTCTPIDTPMAERPNLDEDKGGKLIDPTRFRGMVGSLMYLSASRPDIVFAVCMCARYQAKPTEMHLTAIKRIFRYLKGTIHMGLWYPKDSGFELKAFADADYAGCHDTRRSTSGSAQFLGHRLVSWSSKKQKSTAISTTEAEYIALSGCCAQILWMRSQLRDYG